jgi:hypothetical protein
MQPYFGLKGDWSTLWVTVACATDMTLFGYDQGVFGGVVVTDDYLDVMNLRNNSSLLGTVTAIYDVGCFFGAVFAFVIGDRLGRKKTILLGTTIMSIGAILQIAAFGVPQMIVGRIVAGIGNGLNTATAPVWQGETSKASWRGKLIVIEMVSEAVVFQYELKLTHFWTDMQYLRLHAFKLGYFRILFSQRGSYLEIPTSLSICVHLHTICHGAMASRIA